MKLMILEKIRIVWIHNGVIEFFLRGRVIEFILVFIVQAEVSECSLIESFGECRCKTVVHRACTDGG